MFDRESGDGQRRGEHRAPVGVARPLLGNVHVVGQRRGHGRLNRRRDHRPAVPPHFQQPGDKPWIPGDEAGAVAGEVRPLGQRVNGEQPLVGAAADIGMQHRDGPGFPAQLDVALVTGDDDAAISGPAHDRPHLVHGQHPARRVGRGVQPDQGHAVRRAEHRFAASQQGTDLVGRICRCRYPDPVARPEPELARKLRDQFLGPDHRQNGGRLDDHPEPARQPARRRVPQLRRAGGGRIARGVRRRRKGVLNRERGRVHRRADRQVDDAVRVCAGLVRERRKSIPGEVRQPYPGVAGLPERSGRPCRPGQDSPCGANVATLGGSNSSAPTFDAPPGEPSSSKKTALVSVKPFH